MRFYDYFKWCESCQMWVPNKFMYCIEPGCESLLRASAHRYKRKENHEL